MTVTLLPDTEALVAGFLRGHADIDTVWYGGTVPPDRDPVFPVGRVSAAPGGVVVTSLPLWVAKSLLYFDHWAGTRDAAYDGATAAMGALEQLPGEHDLGTVTACTFTLLPAWDPDGSMGDPAKPRWRFAAYVTAHPGPSDDT